MSCGGNRFACAIRRFQKHTFEPNRPSNQELHNENESRLSELLRAREQQDQTFFPTQTTGPSSTTAPPPSMTPSTTTTMASITTPYTPWVYREEQQGAPLQRG